MNKKNRLLTIGEISSFTGSSVKSLRYYERVGILKPVYINPDSGYRYYSLDQIYLIEIIQFCIELDIPLKELTRFIDTDETIDYASLLSYGKIIAEKKLKMIQSGLKFIHYAEQEIALAEKYHQDLQPYSREIAEKFFYVVPFNHPLEDGDLHEAFAQLFTDLQDYDYDYFDLLEYGILYEYLPSKVNRYVFIEIPKKIDDLENIKIIPAGTYLCQQNESLQIEQVPQIFSGLFRKKGSLLAIETEIFTSKYQISKPIKELRILT